MRGENMKLNYWPKFDTRCTFLFKVPLTISWSKTLLEDSYKKTNELHCFSSLFWYRTLHVLDILLSIIRSLVMMDSKPVRNL